MIIQPVNQLINCWIVQSVNHWIRWPVITSLFPWISESLDQPINESVSNLMSRCFSLLGFIDGDPETDAHPFRSLHSSATLGRSVWTEGHLFHSTHRDPGGSNPRRWGDAQRAPRPTADPRGTDSRCHSTVQTGWVGGGLRVIRYDYESDRILDKIR